MKALWISLVACVLLTAAASSALELNFDVTPEGKTVQMGQAADFSAKLSTDAKLGGVYIYITGGPTSWINVGSSYVTLPAKSMEIPITFYPNNVPGVYTYNVLAQSDAYPGLMEEKQVKLTVVGNEDINIINGKIEKVGDSAVVSMTLQSKEKEAAVIEFSFVDKAGLVGATFTFTEEVEGEKEVTFTVPLASVVSGDYTVNAIVKGTSIMVSKDIHVDPVHKVVKTHENEASPFFNEYRIDVSNKGNVVEEGYVVEADVPTGFVTFSVDPQKCENGVCEWVIPEMSPKDALEITYRIEYWPLVAEGIMIAVLVSVFVVFGWNRINLPSISKRIEGGRSGAFTAVIEIRNSGKKISNVMIKDFVTPLFRIDAASFETMVKPSVRHATEGTELMWTLDSVGPGEHRIIHYKMRPVINGHLRVAKASMKYTLADGKKGRVQSGESFVAA